MYLVELLLPLADNRGEPIAPELFGDVRRELTERFGGLTAFTRAPAKGLWKNESKTKSDDIVVLEVMAERLDEDWWGEYRRALERRFRQDEIVVRASEIRRL